jgi:hypothetical protein
MQFDDQSLGIGARNVTVCQNYLEALGLCVALKQGITLPEHIFTGLGQNRPSSFPSFTLEPVN